jgi:hypothetical protein
MIHIFIRFFSPKDFSSHFFQFSPSSYFHSTLNIQQKQQRLDSFPNEAQETHYINEIKSEMKFSFNRNISCTEHKKINFILFGGEGMIFS